ncbi:MAG TPA: hypothetical protein VIH69_01960 [Dehalococcoidia bacterium]
MTQERALALPDEQQFLRDIHAINRFQQVVHATMIKGLDYGVIPGTQKPTLLKPGAEKIAKLLGLADQYEIMDRGEDWQKPFFRYLIKCRLVHVTTGTVISEGLGECNSMENKYRWRWVEERDLPSGIDKTKLVSRERKSKAGGHWMVYRFDNEDIYSQVNTILKMAKKRSLVDAALSAGRLSDVFTQDIEDMSEAIESEAQVVPAKPIAESHPAGGEEEEQGKGKGIESTAPPSELGIDMVWLLESLKKVHWSDFTLKSWVKSQKWGVNTDRPLANVLADLTAEQKEKLVDKITELVDVS